MDEPKRLKPGFLWGKVTVAGKWTSSILGGELAHLPGAPPQRDPDDDDDCDDDDPDCTPIIVEG